MIPVKQRSTRYRLFFRLFGRWFIKELTFLKKLESSALLSGWSATKGFLFKGRAVFERGDLFTRPASQPGFSSPGLGSCCCSALTDPSVDDCLAEKSPFFKSDLASDKGDSLSSSFVLLLLTSDVAGAGVASAGFGLSTLLDEKKPLLDLGLAGSGSAVSFEAAPNFFEYKLLRKEDLGLGAGAGSFLRDPLVASFLTSALIDSLITKISKLVQVILLIDSKTQKKA